MQSIHKRITRWQIDRSISRAAQAEAQAVGAPGRSRRALSASGPGPAAALGRDMRAGDWTGELVAPALALLGSLAIQVTAKEGSR